MSLLNTASQPACNRWRVRANFGPVRLLATLCWLGWAGGPLCAAEPPAAGPVVVLPPLVVSGTIEAKPWRYVAVPGWEILSRCSDSTTREFVQRQSELAQLFTLVVPQEFQVQLTTPVTFILSPEEQTTTLAKDMVAHRLDRAGPGPQQKNEGAAPVPHEVRFMPNLRLDDRDTFAVFAVINEKRFNASALGLSPGAIHFLLTRRAPALPDWLVAGVLGLCTDLTFAEDAVELGRLTWIAPAETDLLRRLPDCPRTLLAMPDLLAGRMPPVADMRAQRLWLSQCALFVRWALDEKAGGRREAFWDFVRRSTAGPVTEAVFQDCFGLGFADLRDELSDYVPVAIANPLRLRAEKFTKPAIPKSRPATKAEIAWIKGDWERLTIVYLQERHPEYAPKYREQAERTFQHAYAGGERAPSLLAAMGLLECEAGHAAKARALLETAAQAKVARPRVYVELARLRYAEARALPAGHAGRLSPAQADALLQPLVSARALQPALPETYELCAEVLGHAEITLGEPHFAILTEGLRYFPDDIGLLYRAAALHLSHGRPVIAAELMARGLKLAPDGEAHRRFVLLREALRAREEASP